MLLSTQGRPGTFANPLLPSAASNLPGRQQQKKKNGAEKALFGADLATAAVREGLPCPSLPAGGRGECLS